MGTILIIVCIVICVFLVKCMHRLEEMIDLLKKLDDRLYAINGWLADYLPKCCHSVVGKDLEKNELDVDAV